ncbi:hypothetical protein ELY33_13835 [Vreelandella andesensis]|uniref:Uncharacterized protein n=1 Tax=Vreelandella andesensis TaxID=447567 RepID=A0A3S0WGX9_9GAMM|nr:IclR family transcriptional regulator C-terminal domain-containing protein [Halomonas andesensis]RUR28631.1 hypothetical protein ELY33_13835 [Halomonas andesensis]
MVWADLSKKAFESLYNHDGVVEGVVSIMVPVHEFAEEERAELQAQVAKAARTISSMLGHG